MKLDQLTFTRFLAAIAIVVYHFGLNIPPFSSRLLHGFFANANVFVGYFFILSGFVIVIAYAKKDTNHIVPSTYYLARFARIYPLYLLALIAYLLVQLKFRRADLFLNLALLSAWVPGHAAALNPPGWSLSVEAFFYLIFPVLFNGIYKKIKLPKLLIITTALFIVTHALLYVIRNSSFYQGYPSASHDLLYYFPLWWLPDFLMGNALGFLFLKLPSKWFGDYDVPLLLVSALICFSLSVDAMLPIAPILFLPAILFSALNSKGYLTKLFSWRPFIFLGEISYGVYILQVPVVLTVYRFIRMQNVPPVYAFYCVVIVLLITAAITHYVIERPVQRFMRTTTAKPKG